MAVALLKHRVYMDSHISPWMSVILPARLFSPVFIMSVTEQIKKKKAQRSLTLPASGQLAYFTRCLKLMACKLLSGHSLMMSYILTLHTFIQLVSLYSEDDYDQDLELTIFQVCFNIPKKKMVENKGKRASSCRRLIQIQMDDLSPNLAVTELKPFSLSGVLPSCALDTFWSHSGTHSYSIEVLLRRERLEFWPSCMKHRN